MQPTRTECAPDAKLAREKRVESILTPPLSRRSLSPASALALVVLLACFVWTYWPTLARMADRWEHSPIYSHGYLVPVFALGLLWFRRGKLAAAGVERNWSLGLPLLLTAIIIRLVGGYFYFHWLEEISLLPCLAGMCLLIAGWEFLRWSWPAIAFLFFMLPLPYRVEVGLGQPLQSLATQASTYALQTVGCPAFAEGNIIVLPDVGPPYPMHLQVAQACSGLSMLLIFFALSAAVALVIQRPLLEKAWIVASAIPIAIVANVARITATGVLYHTGQEKVADKTFHDLAGWLMMPLGLGLLWMELKILGRLLVARERPRAMPGPFVAPALVAGYRSRSQKSETREQKSESRDQRLEVVTNPK